MLTQKTNPTPTMYHHQFIIIMIVQYRLCASVAHVGTTMAKVWKRKEATELSMHGGIATTLYHFYA